MAGYVLLCLSDCEPEEVDDWSPETSCSQCSFCNLPLDKLSSVMILLVKIIHK